MPIAEAIPAERAAFFSKIAGRLTYYFDKQAGGRPLVLIHSINAAASSYEMGPFFSKYRGQRPVYALDLPGYGFSERSERVYSPELFTRAIEDFIETQVKEPADVIALSLGAEFAARAAQARPDLIHSLTLISPSGLNRGGQTKSVVGRMYGFGNLVHMLLTFPLWARPIFDLIATHSSIEFFLGKSFVGPIPPGLVAYDYASAHQPGAEHAPLYFLSGKLFTKHVRTVIYERLRTPTLVIYDRDAYSNFSALPDLLLKNPAWQAVRLVPTLGLPHFERLADTVDVIDGFWKGIK
jgi:pimeloyl-ACP methyl ester carboxylesterase